MSVYVIAELGGNHDGVYSQALELVDEAARAGADAVKFQCLPPLPPSWMPLLMEYARERGLDCFATPFDPKAVILLAEMNVPQIKISSVEMVYDELLYAAASTGIPLIISTGMASMTQIRSTLNIVRGAGATDIVLMQCTVEYPAAPSHINLDAMAQMRALFSVPTGLSDHSTSVTIPAAAAALEASVIEKHLTLEPDRCRDPRGPDHPFALTPDRFRIMVEGIREVEQALGDGVKDGPVDGEPVELRGRRLSWKT